MGCSHTVPSSSTTPSKISARIAPHAATATRSRYEQRGAHQNHIALSVVATIISVVKMERNTCFIGSRNGGVSGQPKHNAFARKLNAGKVRYQNVLAAICGGKKTQARRSPEREILSQADQSSATTIESLGSRGRTSRWWEIRHQPLDFHLAFQPVMSCAV